MTLPVIGTYITYYGCDVTFVSCSGGCDKKLDVVESQCLGEGRVLGRHNYRSDGANLVADVKESRQHQF